jgi:hypothetical protein
VSDKPRIFVQQKTNSLPATGILYIPFQQNNNTAHLATAKQLATARQIV